MCYAAADINLDGRVDLSDESAWLALLQMGGLNPVTGEPDRRMDLNGDGEVTEADFALWGPLFEQACKRPNEVGAMVDDGPFNGVAEGGVLTVPTRSGTYATGGGTWVMHGVDNRFGFAGYMWDPFLKLYHVRHRVYDPMGGRWLQRDPIGMAGGWNLYQYCGGEPWGMVDPMGLYGIGDWWHDFKAGIAEVIAPETVVGQVAHTSAKFVATAAVGAVVVTGAAAISPVILVVAAVPLAAYGGYQTGVAIEEAVSGTRLENGANSRPLTDMERAESATNAAWGVITVGVMGLNHAKGPSVREACKPKVSGPAGQWTAVNESMSARAAAYQTQITGKAGQAYVVDGVRFDGRASNVLLDAKGPGYANFVKDGKFQAWYKGRQRHIDQANSQIRAANGATVHWHVAEPEAMAAFQHLFRQNNITGIRLIHTPPVP